MLEIGINLQNLFFLLAWTETAALLLVGFHTGTPIHSGARLSHVPGYAMHWTDRSVKRRACQCCCQHHSTRCNAAHTRRSTDNGTVSVRTVQIGLAEKCGVDLRTKAPGRVSSVPRLIVRLFLATDDRLFRLWVDRLLRLAGCLSCCRVRG